MDSRILPLLRVVIAYLFKRSRDLGVARDQGHAPFDHFSPRCVECRRGLAMRILSVRLSVSPSVRLSVRQTRAL